MGCMQQLARRKSLVLMRNNLRLSKGLKRAILLRSIKRLQLERKLSKNNLLLSQDGGRSFSKSPKIHKLRKWSCHQILSIWMRDPCMGGLKRNHLSQVILVPTKGYSSQSSTKSCGTSEICCKARNEA